MDVDNEGLDVTTPTAGGGGASVGDPKPGGGIGEVTLSDLMKELRLQGERTQSEFAVVKSTLGHFQKELETLKSEMVTKPDFDKLEARVLDLETKGVCNRELKTLRQQVSRLDPANKSLRFQGFKGENLADRVASVEFCLSHAGIKFSHMEHIYKKGPNGLRTLTNMCTVELASNTAREAALRTLSEYDVQDPNGNVLKIDRAKSAGQLQRNSALTRASDSLKKANSTKEVKIIWQKDDRNDKGREVTVGNDVAFRQEIDDVLGSFVSPFSGTT